MTEGPDDLAAMTGSESTDEDLLGVDPLERGVEPPERWAEADRFGMTPAEQEEGEPLEERLRQERPDVRPQDLPDDASRLGDDEVIQGRVEELSLDATANHGNSVAESLREPR